MLTIYEVYDPGSPGYRKLFATAQTAKTYWDGVSAEYGSEINVQCHRFEDVGGLLAFLEQDLRDWSPFDLE